MRKGEEKTLTRAQSEREKVMLVKTFKDTSRSARARCLRSDVCDR
jgi:hypothetical protein